MAKRKKQAWSVGDLFTLPLADGTYSIGQIVGQEPEALNSAICAFFTRRCATLPVQIDSPLNESELLAVLFVTRDLLDSGDWKVFSKAGIFEINRYLNVSALKIAGFIGVEIIGSGIVQMLMNAYYSLHPWNAFHDPNYLDKLLVSVDKKPKRVLLK